MHCRAVFTFRELYRVAMATTFNKEDIGQYKAAEFYMAIKPRGYAQMGG